MNTQHPQLLIFDVDGTLTDSAGLTRIAMEEVVAELYGVTNSTNNIKPHGRTDQDIFQEIIDRNDISYETFREEFEKFCGVYIPQLAKHLMYSEKPRLLNGVSTMLEYLVKMDGVFLALGTGNIEQTAYLKLHRHGISHYFPVGGFGSDSSNRSILLTFAIQRAQSHYRVSFQANDIWVIGDTPFDIIAGKKINVNTIGVATGIFHTFELLRHSPTLVFSDFSDPCLLYDAIRENSRIAYKES